MTTIIEQMAKAYDNEAKVWSIRTKLIRGAPQRVCRVHETIDRFDNIRDAELALSNHQRMAGLRAALTVLAESGLPKGALLSGAHWASPDLQDQRMAYVEASFRSIIRAIIEEQRS